MDTVNACCRKEDNLKEVERRPVRYGNDGSDAGTLIVYQCQACQRRHYVHEVKPFQVGISSPNP